MIAGKELASFEVDVASELLRSANWLWDNANFSTRVRHGERNWHSGARFFADRLIRIWRAAGVPEVSHQTPGGPVVTVVAKILRYVDGIELTDETIARELSRRPPSVKQKSEADRSQH